MNHQVCEDQLNEEISINLEELKILIRNLIFNFNSLFQLYVEHYLIMRQFVEKSNYAEIVNAGFIGKKINELIIYIKTEINILSDIQYVRGLDTIFENLEAISSKYFQTTSSIINVKECHDQNYLKMAEERNIEIFNLINSMKFVAISFLKTIYQQKSYEVTLENLKFIVSAPLNSSMQGS